MNLLRKFLTVSVLLLGFFAAQSQVDSTEFYMAYDTINCRYDCHVIVKQGDATDADDRIQFNSQFSVVLPHGSQISLDESYMPLQGNADYSGITPMDWVLNVDSIAFPAGAPTMDFYSVTPNLNVDSRYNDLYPGDTIKLFSLTITPTTNCASDIRIWNNSSDPSSSTTGMEGRDFDNGFTIGSVEQTYAGNATQKYPPKPLILSVVTECATGVEIDLSASSPTCQSPITYAWTGPNGYTSANQDVSITGTDPVYTGDYKVVLTDTYGCQDSITVFGTTKPEAGPDITLCAGESDTLYGTNPSTGVWSKLPSNPNGAVLSNLGGGAANIQFQNTATGTYTFIYSLPGCSDTMVYTINPLPNVSITGSTLICVGDTSYLSPTTGGTWESSDPTVASVDNNGVVVGLKNGATTFTFTDDLTGCKNTTVGSITVNAKPNVSISGTTAVCIGSTTTVSPTSGGTWVVVNDTIASVEQDGTVTGLMTGIAKLLFTEDITGCVSDTLEIEVKDQPIASISGQDTICLFNTTQLLPATGGVWVSNHPLVASVENNGTVLGLQIGFATFTFTDTSSQCTSLPSDTVWVTDGPAVSYNGRRRICEGETTNVLPSTGGTWISTNTDVATVTNAGVVTAVGPGQTTFIFTDATTGCTAELNPALIVDPTPTVTSSQDTICIDSDATLSPASNLGTWTNHTPSIISYSAAGTSVTGLSAGTGKLTFLASSGRCTSDTLYVVVEPRPIVSSDDYDICVGGTAQLSPTTGGFWTSSLDGIATVSPSGLVTGVAAGDVTFTFQSSSSLCYSDPTSPITVSPKPPVEITGDDVLCIGETTSLTPNMGGTWVSNNGAIASVTDQGVVTALSAGFAAFTFTDTISGCVSDETPSVEVKDVPTVSFSGPSEVCVGLTIFVEPTTNGVWESSDTSIAKITNGGVVTGVGPGTAQLTYTETASSCPAPPLTVTVNETPIVSIDGASELCIGSTSQLSPNSMGAWSSNAPGVASVTNGGVVTALMNGSATFTFVSDDGCASQPTSAIVVNDGPTVIFPVDEICVGDTIQLNQITGIWTPSDTNIVKALDSAYVTGVAAGTVTFTYQDTLSGCSTVSGAPFTVNGIPATNLQDDMACVGSTVSIAPFGGGTWESTDESIATINNSGQILTLDTGKVAFIYTRLSTGCQSDLSDSLMVTAGPDITLADDNLCIGEGTNLTPTTGGTWTSSDTQVAEVTDAGVVSAVGPGIATFTFVEDGTFCTSETQNGLVVNPKPTLVLVGDSVICVGGFSQLNPASGGTWVSNNGGIATITNSGLVQGISVGTATFVFTDSITGCPSDNSVPIRVSGSPDAEIVGLKDICIGAKTQLSPASGGVWTSSDPSIATVKNNGEVTAWAPGVVNFTFTETATGCSSEDTTDDLIIGNCINPDFNVTYVDIPVSGDANTNDDVPMLTTYGPDLTLVSSPSGSIESVTLNSNGEYVFTANKIGVYVYSVPVCVPPLVTGCATSLLTITVLDHLSPDNGPVANKDIATTNINTAVEIYSLSNDRCLYTTGCSLEPSSVGILESPSNGSVTVDILTGNTTYTPSNGFVGQDTLRYEVCVSGDLTNCANAIQVITINSASALNSTAAADDFNATSENQPVSGDVSTNDTDAEGNNQTVTGYTSTVDAGTLVLANNGTYTFTPATDFFGPVEFIYTTTDDHPTNPATANATLHILVIPDLAVNVRVYLEGALYSNGNNIGTTHTRPLMRDGLRKSIYNNETYIPTKDPYDVARIYEDTPNFYYLMGFSTDFDYMKNKYDNTSAGTTDQFRTITDSTNVFNVTGEDAIVDWVYVELRDKANNELVVSRRSGLLQRDGDVVDLNGVRSLRFPGIPFDDYYVVVRHRNHLGAMTAAPKTPKELYELVDFTDPNFMAYDKGVAITTQGTTIDYTGLSQRANAKENYNALWAGDFNGDGSIKAVASPADLNELNSQVLLFGTNVTFGSNYDFAYGYRQGDFDLNAKVKFDNPDDDKNLLFATLLFYPLNTELAANYNEFIEQLPEKPVN